MKGFECSGASIPGTDHTRPGQPKWTNNHDAFGFYQDEDCVLAVVCDGCGSTPHPEVGSQIGVRLVLKHLKDAVKGGIVLRDNFMSSILHGPLTHGVLCDLLTIAKTMAGEKHVQDMILHHFLFTIVGVVMTKDVTAIFSFGDGVYGLNSEIIVISPTEGNAPAYLGQMLLPGTMEEKYLKFTLHELLPTDAVRCVLVGTDGLNDLYNSAQLRMPGKDEEVGSMFQFMEDDRYFKNPDAIRRRLALFNLETIDETSSRPRIKMGLLHDDTTMVVIRREVENKE